METIRRVRAATATKNKFEGQTLQWGRRDCLKMAAHVLRLLGHKHPTKGVLAYQSLKGAAKAFKAAGFASLVEAVDSYGLERIPAVSAMPGDLIAFPTEDASNLLGDYSLTVSLGADKCLGFIPQADGFTRAAIGPVSVVADVARATYGKELIAWRSI